MKLHLLSGLLSLLLLVTVGQGRGVAGAKWHPIESEPGWIGLWVDETNYIGRLNPFTGEWEGYGRPKVSVLAFARKVNPMKDTGELKGEKANATAPSNPLPPGRPLLKGDDCDCQKCKCDPCQCGKPKFMSSGEMAAEMERRANELAGPSGNRDAKPPTPAGGVDWNHVADGCGTECYTIGGRQVSRDEALKAIEAAGKVPDDSALPRLVVIGDKATRERVTADLESAGELAQWKGKLVVTSWEPDSWRVADGGFVVPKSANGVVIYVQSPSGRVLWRQDSYDGPSGLAKALRDKVPGYDPAKDPQPTAPVLVPAGGPGVAMGWLLVPVAGVVAFLLGKRRKAVAA